ncbi:MAG: cold-shock protein, partial [Stackebrandtia sp.]
MAEGTVVHFHWRYGYIRPDPLGGRGQSEPDLYVHGSSVQMNNYRPLQVGQRVSYAVGSRNEEFIVETMLGNAAYVHEEHFGKPGRQAVRVTPLTSGDEASDLRRAEALRQATGGGPYT